MRDVALLGVNPGIYTAFLDWGRRVTGLRSVSWKPSALTIQSASINQQCGAWPQHIIATRHLKGMRHERLRASQTPAKEWGRSAAANRAGQFIPSTHPVGKGSWGQAARSERNTYDKLGVNERRTCGNRWRSPGAGL